MRTAAGFGHIILGFANGVLSEMEDRSGQHRGRVAIADAFNQVTRVPTPPEAMTGTLTASATDV